jgi:hypothetical protein
MKRLLLAAALLVVLLGATAEARSPDTYQVTGQVVAVDADVITVLKGGKEKFEIARDPADKTEIKVGDKVTIKYRMSAASIEKKK